MATPETLRWYRAEARVAAVEEYLPDLTLVPRRKRGIGKIPHEHLLPEEGLLLSRLDAHTPIEALVDSAILPREQILRVLYILVRTGIVELVDQARIRREQKEGKELEMLVNRLEAQVTYAKGDPFSTLGIAMGASVSEIKDAFRRLVAPLHPDTMIQHRRLEKRVQTFLDQLIAALDEALRRSAAPPPPPASGEAAPEAAEPAAEVISIPFPNPKNASEEAQNLCAMAIRLAKEGDFASMLVLLERAQKMAPGDLRVELLLGKALLRSRHARYRSERHFQTVLNAQPQNVDAILGMSEFSMHMKMFERSREFLERARALKSDHPGIKRMETMLKKFIA